MNRISLYLAGPMRGYPEHNFPHFNEIAVKLRGQGYEVFNPAENDVPGGTFEDFMAVDLAALSKLGGVAVLDGWKESQGAMIEVTVARMMNKPIFNAYTMEPMEDFRKPTNPKDAVAVDKLDMSLVPWTAIAHLASALVEGDCKYGGFNYREAGVLVSVYIAALMRHIAKYYNGEWEDPATHVAHLASAMACCAIIIDAGECGKLRDDRPIHVNMSDVIDRLSKISGHLKKTFPNSPGRFTQEQKEQKGQVNE
jgi:hypothetical protein